MADLRYIADLHIHSPFSRATSKAGTLAGLAAWAAVKGIQVVGTGDFTHSGWLNQIRDHLEEAEPGFFRLKTDRLGHGDKILPAGLQADASAIRFVLTAEISSIYKRAGRVRKVHNILLAPDLQSVGRINATLAGIGNLESDGRPILGLDSRDLLEIVLEKAPEGFLVPAHIWTPWFSLFGSKSGFDTIEECFGDLAGHIFALETGLSSDPDMNRLISALDRFSLISNSDCHSPGKLGREANIFTTGFDFYAMRDALRKPTDEHGSRRFAATIEFYPEEGKYHCDGHRKCGVSLEPPETEKMKGICPVCGRPLTVGVLNRVMELADRDSPVYLPGAPEVHSLVPLPELLGELLNSGPATKRVTEAYVRLIRQFGSEFSLLLDAEVQEIARAASPLLAEAVERVRDGRVIRTAGYDGEFGNIRVFSDHEHKGFGGQMQLFAGEKTPVVAKKAIRRRSRVTRKKASDVHPQGPAGLNQEQERIVASEARYILVKAGPGTGKTHTLVRRLQRLAGETKETCTVITFTNKAADELRQRVSALIGDDARIFISTFHGYCLRWLRRKNPGIQVAGPEMRRWLLRSLHPSLTFEDVNKLDQQLTGLLHSGWNQKAEMPQALRGYFHLLKMENMIDIDSVVPEATTLLENADGFSDMMRQATGSLFVDEFQDLNRGQYELVRLLAATLPVFAIGDPDQAIYGFRGSSPEWFFQFVHDLQPKQLYLFRNYRSASTIVDAAASVIANNSFSSSPVRNESAADKPGRMYSFRAGSPQDEGEFIVRQVERLVGGTSHREVERLIGDDGSEIGLQDIAVLYRTGRQAEVIADSLVKHGFPVQVVDVTPFYLSGLLQLPYLWIQLAAGRASAADLLNLLRNEKGIGKVRIAEVEHFLAASGKQNPLQLLLDRRSELPERIHAAVVETASLAAEVQETAARRGIVQALQLVMAKYELDAKDEEQQRFLSLAENFGTSLGEFADHLVRYSDSVIYDERAEAIALMTLHASKGLEFKVVFIVGVEEGMLPYLPRRTLSVEEEAKRIEEERRLFYVGMTRAREMLYLCSTKMRVVDGMPVQPNPSRFLQEIPPASFASLANTGQAKRKRQKNKARQLSLFSR